MRDAILIVEPKLPVIHTVYPKAAQPGDSMQIFTKALTGGATTIGLTTGPAAWTVLNPNIYDMHLTHSMNWEYMNFSAARAAAVYCRDNLIDALTELA